MRNRPVHLLFILFVGLLVALPLAARSAAPPPPVEAGVQAFLDTQPGPLKSFRDGDRSAAELIQDVSAYYGVSPRILLSLLEATGALLSTPAPPDAAPPVDVRPSEPSSESEAVSRARRANDVALARAFGRPQYGWQIALADLEDGPKLRGVGEAQL